MWQVDFSADFETKESFLYSLFLCSMKSTKHSSTKVFNKTRNIPGNPLRSKTELQLFCLFLLFSYYNVKTWSFSSGLSLLRGASNTGVYYYGLYKYLAYFSCLFSFFGFDLWRIYYQGQILCNVFIGRCIGELELKKIHTVFVEKKSHVFSIPNAEEKPSIKLLWDGKSGSGCLWEVQQVVLP